MNFKQQLLWLLSEKLTYHEMYHYYQLLVKLDLIDVPMTPELFRIVKDYHLECPFLKRLNLYAGQTFLQKHPYLEEMCFTMLDDVYPKLWQHLPQPPLLMFYRGDLSILTDKPAISMIGTRQNTNYGRDMTQLLVYSLVQAGFVIVSGLADGIDRIAHLAALEQPKSTIAIIASGFNVTYPAKNAYIQHYIADHQLLLSEYLPDTPIRKHHFIMRNRLVAGLSPATLVIEAATKSGSLITANYALQFNREVLALPGRTIDPQSEGTNALIELGAKPILTLNDTLEYLLRLYQNHHYF